ncbi:cytochrome O ubiquinol oxidase subunit I [Salmonella bongori]|nr:cytochrome O ubiquinol oxidase subunit I [Salmonella bongori]
MYIIVAIVMLLRGFADAIMMRSQQALASAGEAGFLPPHHYDQIFTAHGRDHDLLRGDCPSLSV